MRKKQAKRSEFAMHCNAPITGGTAFLRNDTFLVGLGTCKVSAISPILGDNFVEDLFVEFSTMCSSVSASMDGLTWSATSQAGEVAMNSQLQWQFPAQQCTSSCTFGSDVFVGMEFDYIRHLRSDMTEPLWQSRQKLNCSGLALIDQELLVSVGAQGLHLHDLRVGGDTSAIMRQCGEDLSCVAVMGHTIGLGDYHGNLSLVDSRKLTGVVQQFEVEQTGRMVTSLAFSHSQLFVSTTSGKLVSIDIEANTIKQDDYVYSLSSLCCSPDGDLLLLARDDGYVRMHQV